MANLTKKAIMQTFTEMLEEIPFDKITVSALTRKCGISHNTFYYHYQDIYELLDKWLENEFGKYTAELTTTNGPLVVRDLLSGCRERKTVVYHIFSSLSRNNLERYAFETTDKVFLPFLRKLTEGREISEEHLQDVSAFCRYAFLGFFLEYLLNNMVDDVDVLSEKICRLLSDFIEHTI